MTDPAFLTPPIEIAAERPRRDMLASRLKQLGFEPRASSLPPERGGTTPLLIDLASLGAEALGGVQGALVRGVKRPLVVLAESAARPRLRDAIVLAGDRDLETLPARLRLRQRQMVRRDERRLRLMTLDALGLAPADDLSPVAIRALYVGRGGPDYLALRTACSALGVELAAAFSAETALQALSADGIGAVIAVVEKDGDAGTRLLGAFAREAASVPGPVVALSDGPLPAGLMDAVSASFERGASAPAIAGTLNAFLSERVDPMARLTRPGWGAIAGRDLQTGLYEARFFEAHLARQVEATALAGEPLSLAGFRLHPPQGAPQVARAHVMALAGLLQSGLRETDCAARLSTSGFVASLRDTPFTGAARLARRLAERLRAAPVSASRARLADGTALAWRCVERRAYHTPASLLAAALPQPECDEKAA